MAFYWAVRDHRQRLKFDRHTLMASSSTMKSLSMPIDFCSLQKYPIITLNEKKKWWIVICRIAEVIRDILNGVLFYQMLCCVILIALSLTALERNADDFTYDFVISVSSLVAAFVSTFIYCMFADSLTTSLSRFGDIFYNSLWYEMPIKERALLILTIQRSQKLFRLNGYRFYDCSLESFATVNLFDNKMLHTNSQLFMIYSTIQIITGYKGISIILYGPTQVQISHQRAPDIVWSCNNNDCAEK